MGKELQNLTALIRTRKKLGNMDTHSNRNNRQNPHLYHPFHKNSNHHHHLPVPIFCKSSLKDVFHHSPSPSSAASAHETISPKVSCAGHVKRSSRVIGFPNPQNLFSSNNTTPNRQNNQLSLHHFSYHKLKKLFTSKNLICSTTATTGGSPAASSGISAGRRRQRAADRGRNPKPCDGSHTKNRARETAAMNIVELDPPLPVMKRPEQCRDGEEAMSLWKRRSRGVDLKGLQIQQIRSPNQKPHPVSV